MPDLKQVEQGNVRVMGASQGTVNTMTESGQPHAMAGVSQGNIHIVSASQGTVSTMAEAQNIVIHTDGVPSGGSQGDLLAKRTDNNYDVEWITPANSAEQDNTRPITAAAVYTEIGNINAMLSTI